MSHICLICLQEHRHDIRKNFLSFDNVMGKKSVNFSYSDMYFIYLFYFIHIPWIIRDKSHLYIGIVNMEMDATRQT
jgi:hypothetical protein